MEGYLLKSAACLLIFFAFYKFFLEKISAHTFKRFYLLGVISVSFIIPFITFTTYVEVPQTTNMVLTNVSDIQAIPAEESVDYLPYVLWTVYTLGVAFFGFRFCRNLFSIWKKIQQNPMLKERNFFHVLLQKNIAPHTFFSYIFLNKTKYEANEIPKEVLLHEQAHAQEKHSFDILVIELLHVLFWFNPLFIFLKRSMKLNHEFLADRAVLNQGTKTSVYQNLLLAYSSHAVTPQLANSINYSLIKKRFTVMKTHTSKKAIWLRSLFLMPLVALMLYGFSSKQTIVKETSQTETVSKKSIEKATKEQLITYNKLAKKYNAVAIEDRKIPVTDLETLEHIYGLMTANQKDKAQPFPECYLENKIGRYDTYATDFVEGAQKNNKKTFVVMISVNSVTLNGKPSSIKTFKDDLNVITKGWTKNDFNKALPSILISKNSEDYLKKLEVEFQKTDYAQHKKGATLLIPPPPPAPKAPKPPKKVIKGVNDKGGNIPPPPPPPKIDDNEMAPPLPPESLNPVDHITLMAKRNAAFFYEEKRITAEKAIALVKKDRNLNIQTTNFEKSNPIVKISKKGIEID
ncbi:M56 family metallopeptidase [Marixanthomonas ophiurae]|nr:M56 family metallopeptidase [Marixanthomonas ophiurae]